MKLEHACSGSDDGGFTFVVTEALTYILYSRCHVGINIPEHLGEFSQSQYRISAVPDIRVVIHVQSGAVHLSQGFEGNVLGSFSAGGPLL